MTNAPAKTILVTGGNSGIGLALCEQLVVKHDCHVIMGSRSRDRGERALALLEASLPIERRGLIELLPLDVGDDRSVTEAADTIRARRGDGKKLYALVNNAGIGLAANVSADEVVNTNLFGVKRMCDAFVATGLVGGRVVNVGSGSGPSYVRRCPAAVHPTLCTEPKDWTEIEAMLSPNDENTIGLGSEADMNGGYGISKALLSLYTMLLAKEFPEILSSCVSPGWIKTKLVGNSGDKAAGGGHREHSPLPLRVARRERVVLRK